MQLDIFVCQGFEPEAYSPKRLASIRGVLQTLAPNGGFLLGGDAGNVKGNSLVTLGQMGRRLSLLKAPPRQSWLPSLRSGKGCIGQQQDAGRKQNFHIDFCFQCPSCLLHALLTCCRCRHHHLIVFVTAVRYILSWVLSWLTADVSPSLRLLLQLGFLCVFLPPFSFFPLLHCSCCYLEGPRTLCLLKNEKIQIVSVLHFVIPQYKTQLNKTYYPSGLEISVALKITY